MPIDERGIDVDALAASGVRAVILTPTHQFPTGTALAPERRQALVAWAHERDAHDHRGRLRRRVSLRP